MKRSLPLRPKRIVVKVGSGILTDGYRLNKPWIKKFLAQISALINKNMEVILVTSGAIASGMGMLGLKSRPKLLPQQQATAAIGQSQLMKIYDTLFREHELLCAQILLTREDLNNRRRYLNAKNTLFTLLSYKVVPVINENDTVSVDEIKFGDNDRLSAEVAALAQAELLIILSDVDGLYNQAGEVIRKVEKVTSEIEKLAGASKRGALGTGGMASKVQAAKICAAAGIACIVANGKTGNILDKILNEQDMGTLFLPGKQQKLVARKRWIGFSAKAAGKIVVDEGAKQALVKMKKSLLAKGIVSLSGNFAAGDMVSVLDSKNCEFARGLINYSSEELNKIKGESSSRIEAILGYKYYDEVIHRNNLVVL